MFKTRTCTRNICKNGHVQGICSKQGHVQGKYAMNMCKTWNVQGIYVKQGMCKEYICKKGTCTRNMRKTRICANLYVKKELVQGICVKQ